MAPFSSFRGIQASRCPEIPNWFERHYLNLQHLSRDHASTELQVACSFSLAAAVKVSALKSVSKHLFKSIWGLTSPTDCCKITLEMLHGEIFFSVVLKQVSSHFSFLGECWNAEASEMFCGPPNTPSAWGWVENNWIFILVGEPFPLRS